MVGIKFAVDVAGVSLDCVQREVKLAGDFLIGQPLGDELEYFNLALA
jgi:hypothetical protein